MSYPLTTNITAVLGEDKTWTDTINNAAGTPQDLTNWTFSFCIAIYGDRSAVVIGPKTLGNGVTVPSPANGQAVIALAQADTWDAVNGVPKVFPGAYDWWIERTNAGGDAQVSRGICTLFDKGS